MKPKFQKQTVNLSSCNVVFLIFPINTTFQFVINEVVYFPLLKKMNSAIIIFKKTIGGGLWNIRLFLVAHGQWMLQLIY
jgi:hypothetical protein